LHGRSPQQVVDLRHEQADRLYLVTHGQAHHHHDIAAVAHQQVSVGVGVMVGVVA
jgi:hypothetical protein